MGYFDKAIQTKLEGDELAHHGILGQKWGVRRYQNPDGTLTIEGRKRLYKGGAEIGGYESLRNRNKRSIEAAKYARDIRKNNKKLDKAIDSGNEKKIAKYSKMDEILNTNRKHMLKDLSDEEIKMGEDYLKTMRNMSLGVLFGGVIGGTAAGLYTRNKLNSAENEKKVYAQDAERKEQYKNAKQAERESQKPSAVMVTESEAKKLGLDNSTKFTDKEASDFWKAYAKQAEQKGKFSDAKDAEVTKSISGNFGKVPEEWKTYYDNTKGYETKNVSFSKQKIGNATVVFNVDNTKSKVSNEEAAANAQKFLKTFDDSKAREAIAKEVYDDRVGMDLAARGISRETFKKRITPSYARTTEGFYEVSYDDGGLTGGHSLDIEGDPKTAKIRYVSMNG